MTSSGTYSFDPSAADVASLAYARVGIRRAALTNEHLTDAIFESNFLLSEFSNLQPLLWKSTLISQVSGIFGLGMPSDPIRIRDNEIGTGVDPGNFIGNVCTNDVDTVSGSWIALSVMQNSLPSSVTNGQDGIITNDDDE